MCNCSLTRRGMLTFAGAGAAALLAGCDEAGNISLVSDATVEAMGLRAWADIRRTTPVARNSDLQQLLDRVAGRLLAAAGRSPREWEIVIFARPEMNAFALPGKKIGVFQGMFRVLSNEDQLAAVVGHEIGHLQADHGKARMNAEVAKGWGLRIVALLLQLGGVEYAPEIAAALGLGVEYGLVLPYSRRQELEADRLGLRLMRAGGFRPEATVELWQRMEAAGSPRLPEFLTTHPAPKSRIKAIREMLAQAGR